MKKYTYIFGMIIAALAATACSVEYAVVPTVRVERRVKIRNHRVNRHLPPPPAPAPAYRIPGTPGYGAPHNTTIIIANNPKPAPAPAPKATPKVNQKATPKATPATPAPAARPSSQPRSGVSSSTRQVSPTTPANGTGTRSGSGAQRAPATRSTSSAPTNTANRGR